MTDALARAAAALWGLGEADIRLAARRENTVYRVTSAEGDYALRLHRQGYRTAAELTSELQWMAALAADNMAVPTPRAALSGNWIETVAGVHVDLLNWLPGRQLGVAGTLVDIDDRAGFCRDLGAAMAELHRLSDAWDPPDGFTRPSWNRDGLLGDAPVWGRFWDHPALTREDRDILIRTRDAANAHLARIEGGLDYGLIHADLLSENIMVAEGRPYMIDFDDSGFGFRDFELATFLLRFLPAADYEDLRDALCEGYATRRKVLPEELDLFILLRALTYPGWIMPRMNEPGGAERSARAISTALPLARAYLAQHDS